MHIEPYLFFEGRCEEAIEFYRKTIGAELLMLMRVKEVPEAPPGEAQGCPAGAAAEEARPPSPLPPGSEEKVMHAALRIGESTLLLSDGMMQGEASFRGVSLSLHAADEAEAARLFAALSDGGEVQQPLVETFFSPAFGVVSDRFGVSWMVLVDTGDGVG